MGSLYYVGKKPSENTDLTTRGDSEATFRSGTTRSYVATQIASKTANKVTKAQVDTWDSDYAPVTYYQQQDDLLIPLSAKGAVGGVATLTSTTGTAKDGTTGYVVTASQLPVLGAGLMRGPYGMTKQYTRSDVGSAPQIIGEWLYPTNTSTSFGKIPLTGHLLAFVITAAQNTGGRTVLEVRAGTTNVYAEQSLIATGYGRNFFDGYQIITVLPAGADNLGQSGTFAYFNASVGLNVTLWMYNSGGVSATTAGLTYSSALFVSRTAQ